MKVLLVDDEVEFTSALAERLELRGFAVTWTNRAEDALKLVEGECFDAAVLDVKMPKIDGIELRHRMKDRCEQMGFVFLSGHGSPEAFEKVRDKCDGDTYLIKPVRIETLIDEIYEVASCSGQQMDGVAQ